MIIELPIEQVNTDLPDHPSRGGLSGKMAVLQSLLCPPYPMLLSNVCKMVCTVSVVLLYFLASGTHVVEEFLEQVAIRQKQYAGTDIHITPYLRKVAKVARCFC